ncbi:MAG: hypothetical protein ACR2OZ_02035 [Verrucomicrobiales bacterium]
MQTKTHPAEVEGRNLGAAHSDDQGAIAHDAARVPQRRSDHCLGRSVLVLLLAATCLTGQSAVDFYSPDSSHLWNRLYSGLIVRTKDGVVLDDLLDPPFWAATRHLLTGESHTNALALLREFAEDRDALRQMTPLQRAVMQRDLIAMFHWVEKTPMGLPDFTPEQCNLAEAMVRAIRQVALTADEIHTLRDNYALASALPGAITAFDDKQPRRAFLPKDLLSDEGDWLALEPRRKQPLATPAHFRAFAGRSALELRFRHAGGREAGEKYLETLAALPKPFVFEKPTGVDMRAIMPYGDLEKGPWVNPETPQFPPGSMWALVRRAILVDTQANLVASPLIESVQVRVYRTLDPNPEQGQTVFEWEMSRRLLFAHGGFHLTKGIDQRFSQFMNGPLDPIESYDRLELNSRVVCAVCHMGSGIHSVQSRSRVFNKEQFEKEPDRPPEFRAVTSKRLEEVTLDLASKRPNWQLLRRMWSVK